MYTGEGRFGFVERKNAMKLGELFRLVVTASHDGVSVLCGSALEARPSMYGHPTGKETNPPVT